MDSSPALLNFASSLATGPDSSVVCSGQPTNNHRSSGNTRCTAAGASQSGDFVHVHFTGRLSIAAPKRYLAETTPLIESPASGIGPSAARAVGCSIGTGATEALGAIRTGAKLTSTRKSGRRYAATRNDPWTILWNGT
jgi:hypothetical protein